MTPQELARIRSANQRIVTRNSAKPAEIVSWFGAMQAQDYPAAKWALGLRLKQATDQSIEEAITHKQLVRTWPMRGTLHFVPPADAHWMLALMAQRVIKRSAGRYKQLHLTDADFTKARHILTKAMQGGEPLIRKEVIEILEAGGFDTAGQRGYHALGHLAQQGLIAIAGLRNKQPEFVWFDDWFPPALRTQMSHDEALVEMARRYIRSHGPVTVYDFAWWSGLAISECRTAFATLQSKLVTAILQDKKEPYWFFPHTNDLVEDSVRLVPPFDETIVAYKDRSAIILPDDFKKVVPYTNGIFSPVVLVNGQFAGLWRRTITKQGVTVVIELSHKVTKAQLEHMRAEAERYAQFLQLLLSDFTVEKL